MPCNFMELYTFQSILIYNIHLSTDFQKRLILKLRQTMLVLENGLLLFNTVCSKNCCLEVMEWLILSSIRTKRMVSYEG